MSGNDSRVAGCRIPDGTRVFLYVEERGSISACCPFFNKTVLTAAAAAAGRFKFDVAGKLESVVYKIDFYGCCFFQELFINQVLKTFNIENVVGLLRLVQSHCQRRPASTAFIQKDSNGCYVLVFEVFGNLLSCRFSNFYHNLLLNMIFDPCLWLSGIHYSLNILITFIRVVNV